MRASMVQAEKKYTINMKDFDESEHPRDEDGKFTFKDMADAAVLVGHTNFLNKPISYYDYSDNYSDTISEEQHQELNQISGKKLPKSAYMNLLGGFVDPDLKAENVKFVNRGNGGMYAMIRTDKYRVTRGINFNTGVIENYSMNVDPEYQGQGIGTKLLYNQVHQAQELGFKTIMTYAQRTGDANGYYTWPRLGYKMDPASLPPEDHYMADSGKTSKQLVQDLAEIARIKADDLTEMMSTKEGRELWKTMGFGFDAEFDLTPGSESQIILDNVYKHKFKK